MQNTLVQKTISQEFNLYDRDQWRNLQRKHIGVTFCHKQTLLIKIAHNKSKSKICHSWEMSGIKEASIIRHLWCIKVSQDRPWPNIKAYLWRDKIPPKIHKINRWVPDFIHLKMNKPMKSHTLEDLLLRKAPRAFLIRTKMTLLEKWSNFWLSSIRMSPI